MPKILGEQDIPAFLTKKYKYTLHLPTPNGTIRRRYPFQLPKMRDGSPLVNPLQAIHRARFKKCVKCWKRQPDTEEEIPAGSPVRARTQWFEDAVPSGLWYYDYFIQQSIAYYITDDRPPWCPCSDSVARLENWGPLDANDLEVVPNQNNSVTLVSYPNTLYGDLFLPWQLQQQGQWTQIFTPISESRNRVVLAAGVLPNQFHDSIVSYGHCESKKFRETPASYDTTGSTCIITYIDANWAVQKFKVNQCSKLRIWLDIDWNGGGCPATGTYPTSAFTTKIAPLFLCVTFTLRLDNIGQQRHYKINILQPFSGGAFRRVESLKTNFSAHSSAPDIVDPGSDTVELLTGIGGPFGAWADIPLYGLGIPSTPEREYQLRFQMTAKTGYFTGQQQLSFTGAPLTGTADSIVTLRRLEILEDFEVQ